MLLDSEDDKAGTCSLLNIHRIVSWFSPVGADIADHARGKSRQCTDGYLRIIGLVLQTAPLVSQIASRNFASITRS